MKDIFGINSSELQILQTIRFYENYSTEIKNLKQPFSANSDFFVKSISSLEEKGLLRINEKVASLTKEGIARIEFINSFGGDWIIDGDYDNGIIAFLYYFNDTVPAEYFPQVLKDNADSKTKGTDNTYHLLDYIVYNSGLDKYIDTKNQCLSLNKLGRQYWERILEATKEVYKKNSEDSQYAKLKNEIDVLTRESLVYEKERRALKETIEEQGAKLTSLQVAELKSKRWWAFISAIGGALLTFIVDHYKDILKLFAR